MMANSQMKMSLRDCKLVSDVHICSIREGRLQDCMRLGCSQHAGNRSTQQCSEPGG